MAHCEVDSFLSKFKHLWHSGINATLTVKSTDGEATVVLTADLGPIPFPPLHLPRHHGQPLRQQRGPAYQRRQERRRQASGKAAEQVNDIAVEADEGTAAAKAGEASAVSAEEAVQDTSDQTAEEARNDFPCLLCDFVSIWESGLHIHMTKKHSMMEQVDGNATLMEDALVEDDKYADTCHYWKTGRLGTAFQTFIDANTIIDSSNFPEEFKVTEKAKILEARKYAFGENYKDVPPWNQRL